MGGAGGTDALLWATAPVPVRPGSSREILRPITVQAHCGGSGWSSERKLRKAPQALVLKGGAAAEQDLAVRRPVSACSRDLLI